MNIIKNNKITLAKAAETAATSNVDTAIIDMLGFESCAFVGTIGTANSGNYCLVQQGDNSSLTDAAALEGTKIIVSNSGDAFLTEIFKPTERYLRLRVVRGASSTTGDIYAIQSGAHKAPVSHGSTIEGYELHVSPAEGTI